ncbi:MAG: hypothetical protein U0800_17580 [Isosphaeraceae bacterium]
MAEPTETDGTLTARGVFKLGDVRVEAEITVPGGPSRWGTCSRPSAGP